MGVNSTLALDISRLISRCVFFGRWRELAPKYISAYALRYNISSDILTGYILSLPAVFSDGKSGSWYVPYGSNIYSEADRGYEVAQKRSPSTD